MKALIKHTLKTNKGWLIFYGILLLGGVIASFWNFLVSTAFFIAVGNVALLLPGFSHQSDVGFNWNSFVLTLPVSKKQVVKAKYHIAVALCLLTILLYIISLFLSLKFSDTVVPRDETLARTFIFFGFMTFAFLGNLLCFRFKSGTGIVGGLFGSVMYASVNTVDRNFLVSVSEKEIAVGIIILVTVALYFITEKAAIRIYEKHGVK